MGQSDSGCANLKKEVSIDAEEAARRVDEGKPVRWAGLEFFKPEIKDDTIQMVERQTKPKHIGAWMMSWTRVQFQQVHDLLKAGGVMYENTDSIRVPLSCYHRLKEAGWIDQSALGLLKIEYGVVYEYSQGAGGNYQLKVIKPDSSLDVVVKG